VERLFRFLLKALVAQFLSLSHDFALLGSHLHPTFGVPGKSLSIFERQGLRRRGRCWH